MLFRSGFEQRSCEFDRVIPYRMGCLHTAWQGFQARASHHDRNELADFCRDHAHWLDDYALFMVLDRLHGAPWSHWPTPLARRHPEALASVRETHPLIKVLMVSMYPEDQYALRCLKAGAHGYANKAGDPTQLITAVHTIAQGRKYLTPEVAQMMADSLADTSPETPHAALSERELQTLVKIASGKRLSDIAEELMLSPKTVSVYRARVLEKLQLSNNAELTVYAIRNQLV